jgi:hypothetical protein
VLLNARAQFHDPPPTDITHGKLIPEFMYIQNSTNMFEVVKSTLTGLVPKFIVPEFGKLTAVLLVGASVTSAALP